MSVLPKKFNPLSAYDGHRLPSLSEVRYIREFLEKVTYKPGCKFSAQQGYGCIQVILEAEVPDAEDPTKTIKVKAYEYIPTRFLDRPEQVLSCLSTLIHVFETHEIDEFFKVDGEHVHPPH